MTKPRSNQSLEPATDVTAPASSPPVHDSAVPIIQSRRNSASPTISASPWMAAAVSGVGARPARPWVSCKLM
ncbi:Uncharacterised protein [Bordetella pertussis]|nr:Uncharacterised protein [Bordetella pertussis]